MRVDALREYSDAQAETTVAAHDSDSVLDHGEAGDANQELYLVVNVPVAVTSDGAPTLVVDLLTATDAAFTTPVTLWTSGSFLKAALTIGTNIAKVRIPKGLLQFSKVTYTIGTAVLTAGAFDAFLTDGLDNSFEKQNF